MLGRMRDGPGDGLSAEPRVADVADAQRRERPEGARLEHDMALPELRELHCALSAADRHSAYDGLPARRVVAGGMRRRKGETGRGLPPGVPRLGEIHRTGLIAGFKARTMRLAQDLPLVPDMLAKGKLSLLPEQVKNKKAIRHIFDEAGKAGKKL